MGQFWLFRGFRGCLDIFGHACVHFMFDYATLLVHFRFPHWTVHKCSCQFYGTPIDPWEWYVIVPMCVILLCTMSPWRTLRYKKWVTILPTLTHLWFAIVMHISMITVSWYLLGLTMTYIWVNFVTDHLPPWWYHVFLLLSIKWDMTHPFRTFPMANGCVIQLTATKLFCGYQTYATLGLKKSFVCPFPTDPKIGKIIVAMVSVGDISLKD